MAWVNQMRTFVKIYKFINNKRGEFELNSASSKGTVVCGLLSFILVSLLVVFPGYDISGRLTPISKGPRPYKILTVEEPQKSHFRFK